jgi:flagellar M-ring protein FliF
VSKPDLKAQVTDFGKKRWADFQGFSAGQKAVTVVAVLALAIGGYLLATWKSEPAYAPLYSNLAGTDASAIVSKLDDKGIPYKLTDGGAGITVPTGQVDAARLAVSAAGLPNSGQTGYALLDKEGVTTSQFKQQVDYQRAVEGELARTIQSIDGVQAASVHLAIPKDDVFSDGSDKPTAAVLLTVAPGTTLTSSQVQSVVYLVSSSVTGMKTGNVTVTDSNGNVLSSPDGGLSGAVTTADQAKTAQDLNTRYAANLQSLIDASLGPGHAKVVVNAALNFDKSTTKTDKYLYDKNTPPVSVQKKSEKYTGAGGVHARHRRHQRRRPRRERQLRQHRDHRQQRAGTPVEHHRGRSRRTAEPAHRGAARPERGQPQHGRDREHREVRRRLRRRPR